MPHPEFTKGFEAFHQKLTELGVKTCIGTGGCKAYIDRFVKTLGLKSFFGERLYGRDNVGGKFKPNPDIFLYAMEQLGVKPEECVIFEDSLPGFKAAKAAGVTCIGIRSRHNAHLGDHVAAFVDSFDEAMEAIMQLSPQPSQSEATDQAQL